MNLDTYKLEAIKQKRKTNRATDETGNVYGLITVISRAPGNKDNKAYWICRCACGSEFVAMGKHLRYRHTTSCGCNRGKPLPMGEAAFNAMVLVLKRNARNRGLEWSLSNDEVRSLSQLNCSYCGGSPENVKDIRKLNGTYTYNGLDRIDNTKGYTIDNVTPCCFVCNRAKGNLPIEQFITWIFRVSEYLRENIHATN